MNQGLGNVLLGVAARDIFVPKPKAKSKTVPPDLDFKSTCHYCSCRTNSAAYSEGRYVFLEGRRKAQAVCESCATKRSLKPQP